MDSDSRLRPLRGIIPPMVTPLASLTALDHKGLETIIEHILAGGVHALFLLGTTGEGPSLTYAVRRELIERVCKQVGNRVPVLVGITDTAYIESLRLAEHAAYAGASAVVAAPPYYFPVSQTDLLRLIEGWARESALPVYLYNQPALTKIAFDPQTVQLASGIPNVFGIRIAREKFLPQGSARIGWQQAGVFGSGWAGTFIGGSADVWCAWRRSGRRKHISEVARSPLSAFLEGSYPEMSGCRQRW